MPNLGAPLVVTRGNRRVANWPAIGIHLLCALALICVVLPVVLRGMSASEDTRRIAFLVCLGSMVVVYTVRLARGFMLPVESPPLHPHGGEKTKAAARRRVNAPASGLLWWGAFQLLLFLLVTVRGFDTVSVHQSFGLFGYWRVFLPEPLAPVLAVLAPYLHTLSLLVVLGAYRMRRLESYGLAVTAGVLAMITPPLLPIGLPLGVWALIVLARKDVRREFGRLVPASSSTPPEPAPRFSKLAIASLILTMACFLISCCGAGIGLFKGVIAPQTNAPMFLSRLVSSVFHWIESWPALSTVLLAAVALEDIRRNCRRFKGAGLATFGLLCMPIACMVAGPLLLFPPFQGSGNGSTREMAELSAMHAQWVGISLLSTVVALVVSAGAAFWVHAHELRRWRAGDTGVEKTWWLLSKPTVRCAQLIAFAVLLSHGYMSGRIAYFFGRGVAEARGQAGPSLSHPQAPVTGSESNAANRITARAAADATSIQPVAAEQTPASPPTVEQILAHYAKAKGEMAGPEKIRTLTMKGHFTSRDGLGTSEAAALVKSPDKWLLSLQDINGPVWRRAFDGSAAWEVARWGSPEVEPGNLLSARAVISLLRGDPLTPFIPSMSLKGKEPFGRGQAYVVAVALPGQTPRLWFDTETGLLVRMEYEFNRIVLQLDFSDYRDIGGLMVPFNMREAGTESWTVQCSEVKLNEPIDDAVFARPATR